MKVLKKFRYSITALALVGALAAPVIAQAEGWICICEITEDGGICICFPEAEESER